MHQVSVEQGFLISYLLYMVLSQNDGDSGYTCLMHQVSVEQGFLISYVVYMVLTRLPQNDGIQYLLLHPNILHHPHISSHTHYTDTTIIRPVAILPLQKYVIALRLYFTAICTQVQIAI